MLTKRSAASGNEITRTAPLHCSCDRNEINLFSDIRRPFEIPLSQNTRTESLNYCDGNEINLFSDTVAILNSTVQKILWDAQGINTY